MLQCGQLRVLGDHSIEACESHARKIRSRAAFVLMLLKVNKQPYRVQGKNIRTEHNSTANFTVICKRTREGKDQQVGIAGHDLTSRPKAAIETSYSKARYSKATPSGAFSPNHVSAASAFANSLRCSGSPTCLLVLS